MTLIEKGSFLSFDILKNPNKKKIFKLLNSYQYISRVPKIKVV